MIMIMIMIMIMRNLRFSGPQLQFAGSNADVCKGPGVGIGVKSSNGNSVRLSGL